MAGKVTIIREYLTVKELSEYCGISERTLRDLINNSMNPIPSFRFGRAVRVKKEEFDQWAKTFCQDDNDKIDKILNEVLKDLGIRSKVRTGKPQIVSSSVPTTERRRKARKSRS